MRESLRRSWRLTRDEVRARPGRFLALTTLVLGGYGLLIFALTAATTGRLPNYFRLFDVAEGVIEALTLSMSLPDRYYLLAEQPVLEFGYRYPGGGPIYEGTMEGVYTLTLHVVGNLGLMSMLMAVYFMLLGRVLRVRRVDTGTAGGSAASLGGGSVGVLSAGAASMACCGGGGVSILLSLLGFGAGIGAFMVEYDQLFGLAGLAVVVGSVWLTGHLTVSKDSPQTTPATGGRSGNPVRSTRPPSPRTTRS
jgi:hypothetical protein